MFRNIESKTIEFVFFGNKIIFWDIEGPITNGGKPIFSIINSEVGGMTDEEDWEYYNKWVTGEIKSAEWCEWATEIYLDKSRKRKYKPTRTNIEMLCDQSITHIRPEARDIIREMKRLGFTNVPVSHSPLPYVRKVDEKLGNIFDVYPDEVGMRHFNFRYNREGEMIEITPADFFGKDETIDAFVRHIDDEIVVYSVGNSDNDIQMFERALELGGMAFAVEPDEKLTAHPKYSILQRDGLENIPSLNAIPAYASAAC